jgi:putative intracellular protease/amidase
MKTIVSVITEGFAEWETALVNGAAAGFYGMRTRFAAPGGKMVTSAGGMRVIPDVALEALIVDDFDALLVCGGTAWQNPGAPDIGELLLAARKAGKLIGIICDGTVAAARTGLLDDIAHTSNGAGYLDEKPGTKTCRTRWSTRE